MNLNYEERKAIRDEIDWAEARIKEIKEKAVYGDWEIQPYKKIIEKNLKLLAQ
jgi:hypothetical protein